MKLRILRPFAYSVMRPSLLWPSVADTLIGRWRSNCAPAVGAWISIAGAVKSPQPPVIRSP